MQMGHPMKSPLQRIGCGLPGTDDLRHFPIADDAAATVDPRLTVGLQLFGSQQLSGVGDVEEFGDATDGSHHGPAPLHDALQGSARHFEL